MPNHGIHIRRPSAGTILGLVAIIIALAGGGFAARAKPKGDLAKFYSARDYRPDHSTYEYGAIFLGSMTCLETPNLEGTAEFTIRFDLPDGAAITKITAHYTDNDPDHDIDFGPMFSEVGVSDELYPGASSSGASTDMASVEMTPDAPVIVDNTNRRYGVMANFEACNDSGNLAVDAVKVDYRLS